jgi:alpha-tubulin suppressor-like RCC1 family protein
MGESHTVGLMKDGTVVAVGSNHCGQCEVEDWSNVVYIAACEQCTIGLTADGELLIAGAFE